MTPTSKQKFNLQLNSECGCSSDNVTPLGGITETLLHPAQSPPTPKTLAQKVFCGSLQVFVNERLLDKPLFPPYTNTQLWYTDKNEAKQWGMTSAPVSNAVHRVRFPFSAFWVAVSSFSNETHITANHTSFAKGHKCPPSTFCSLYTKPPYWAAEDSERSILLPTGRISASHRGTPACSPGLESSQTPTQPIATLHYPSHFPIVWNLYLAHCSLIPQRFTLFAIVNPSLSAAGCPGDTSVFFTVTLYRMYWIFN